MALKLTVHSHNFSYVRKRRQTLICRLVLLLPLPDSGHTQESRARSCAACPGMVDTWVNDSGHGLQQRLKQMLQTSVTSLCRRFAEVWLRTLVRLHVTSGYSRNAEAGAVLRVGGLGHGPPSCARYCPVTDGVRQCKE